MSFNSFSKYISILAIGFSVSHATLGQNGTMRVLKSFPVAGEGRWDYIALCPSNENLYVSHGTKVDVINKMTGSPVAVIPNTEGVHGIAFATEYKKGFTSNGKLNTLTVFDVNTNSVIGSIPVGENPDAIFYEPVSKKLWVCNGKSKNISIVDPATDKVINTIDVGGKPETAVSDEAGKVYVNIEDKNEILQIDATKFKVLKHFKIGKGEEPSGLAINVKTKRLFAGCGNKLLVVLNPANGKIVKELPIGDGCDGVDYDPELGLIYSSNGEGTLTVVKENGGDSFDVIDNLKTRRSARTLVSDNKMHRVYLPYAQLQELTEEDRKAHKRALPEPNSFQVLVVGR
jgi:YVTN family beta-propeller protein